MSPQTNGMQLRVSNIVSPITRAEDMCGALRHIVFFFANRVTSKPHGTLIIGIPKDVAYRHMG
ncbi:MAG: hypothetical protein ABI618_00715 [Nitrospirota bacterium]